MLADSGAIFDPELLDVFFDVVVTGNGNGHAVAVAPQPEAQAETASKPDPVGL